MRVLLVQPPFWAVNSPSIGLSYLRAALHDVGMEADILYSNLDYANLIGREIYGVVQAQLPVDLLFGDLVFGPALQATTVQPDLVRDLMDTPLSTRSVTRSVPEGSIEQYAALAKAAIRFIEEFKESKPWQGYDLVGFTTTFSLVPALAMARAIKMIPNAPPIVFGGCHCDGSLGEALMRHFPWIDFVARGDGEKLIVALAEHLREGRAMFHGIEGLLWREGEAIGGTDKPRAHAEDLDELPEPMFTDWLARLETLGWKDLDTLRLPIETSRGCWYGQRQQCIFCGLNGASLEFRSKGADRILKDYVSLLEYGIPVIYAVDSVLDPRFFKDVIPRLEALPRKAMMFFEVRATHSRAQLLALRKAGIRVLQPGIESLNSRLLKLMNKGTTAFQNVRLLRWAAELSMPISWNILCGLPGEEADDYASMSDLVRSLAHLLPPVTECNLIHVDRFSPLFEQHQDAIQPIAPYALALGLNSEAVRELAYHFEFNEGLPITSGVSGAIQHLREAVLDWQAAVGSVAFVKLEREGKCWLYDTRPGASLEEACLQGVRGQAYQMMDEGCTRDAMKAELGLSPSTLEELIDEFQSHRWIAELDGKCLSLAVSVDEEVPEAIPELLQGSVATALYHHRMSQLWKTVKV